MDGFDVKIVVKATLTGPISTYTNFARWEKITTYTKVMSSQPHHCNRETRERKLREDGFNTRVIKERIQAQVSVDIVFIIYKVYYLSQESWGACWGV